jgi:hypothetical protein
MTEDRRDPAAALQADMNAAAFGAAHATSVSEERQRSQIELIWAELRWHKWLLFALLGGIAGQYIGLSGAVSQAMPFK